MKIEYTCEGVTVHQIEAFLTKEAGNKVPVPGQDGKKIKIPKGIKVLERSEDKILMKKGSLYVTVINATGCVQITSEVKWVVWFFACLIPGIIIWPMLFGALSMLISRYTWWPARWERFNKAVCEGAKAIPA